MTTKVVHLFEQPQHRAVVAAPHRVQGVGSLLVRTLIDHARRLRLLRVTFGTDCAGFWFMRFDL